MRKEKTSESTARLSDAIFITEQKVRELERRLERDKQALRSARHELERMRAEFQLSTGKGNDADDPAMVY